MIFPEGGRSPDGWAQEFTGGAAYLAFRTGAPVVPVHIEGTRHILPKGWPRASDRSRTTVTFGTPLWPEDGENARRFATRIETAVATMANEATHRLVDGPPGGGPGDHAPAPGTRHRRLAPVVDAVVGTGRRRAPKASTGRARTAEQPHPPGIVRRTHSVGTPVSRTGPAVGSTGPYRKATSVICFICGRRTKWLVLVVWVVILALAGGVASKLMSVEKNDAISFLPPAAQSTKVQNLAARFPSGKTQTGHRRLPPTGGLTAADRATIEADRAGIDAHPTGPPGSSRPWRTVTSTGPTAYFAVPLSSTVEIEPVTDAVDAIRSAVGTGIGRPGGEVTGPAASLVDRSARSRASTGPCSSPPACWWPCCSSSSTAAPSSGSSPSWRWASPTRRPRR